MMKIELFAVEITPHDPYIGNRSGIVVFGVRKMIKYLKSGYFWGKQSTVPTAEECHVFCWLNDPTSLFPKTLSLSALSLSLT